MSDNKETKFTDATYSSIEEAVKCLGLSKRVRWKNYLGYLCRYTKKSICPEFVAQNGIPVQIKEAQSIIAAARGESPQNMEQ